ncbi:MAG: alpha/beta hydrolase-fold protein, partial [Pseudomonadota bacterium]
MSISARIAATLVGVQWLRPMVAWWLLLEARQGDRTHWDLRLNVGTTLGRGLLLGIPDAVRAVYAPKLALRKKVAKPRLSVRCRSMWRLRLAFITVAFAVGMSATWFSLPWLAPVMSSPSDWTPTPISGVRTECFDEETAGRDWSYCVHRTATNDSTQLLVHLHGRRGNARWWNDQDYYTGELYAQWAKLEVPAPTVASVSFGPLWLLKSTEGVAFFVGTVMPTIKRRLANPNPSVRVLGESMGGLNTLMLAVFAGEHFDRAAVLCAPISTTSPYDLGESISAVRGSSMSWTRAFMLLSFGRYFFRDHEDWRANDPLSRIPLADTVLPQMY